MHMDSEGKGFEVRLLCTVVSEFMSDFFAMLSGPAPDGWRSQKKGGTRGGTLALGKDGVKGGLHATFRAVCFLLLFVLSASLPI
jgi:hypothetical protein